MTRAGRGWVGIGGLVVGVGRVWGGGGAAALFLRLRLSCTHGCLPAARHTVVRPCCCCSCCLRPAVACQLHTLPYHVLCGSDHKNQEECLASLAQ